ncbi:hypothetical protein SELMODRAFT_412757 [Selaginella moellendorffii]|uniref:Uncharacterized protein n=1 Tax=Selaginella moellendorffii TaxID=88036 RepID=D8RLD5_SELML|nr:hypothetical protein SELMODRAFT_412757 [Selaginella moellendorffii]
MKILFKVLFVSGSFLSDEVFSASSVLVLPASLALGGSSQELVKRNGPLLMQTMQQKTKYSSPAIQTRQSKKVRWQEKVNLQGHKGQRTQGLAKRTPTQTTAAAYLTQPEDLSQGDYKDLSFMPLSYSPRHSTLGFGALKADRVATGESQGEVDSKVEESVLVLKAAAKSKKIPAPEVFAAFRVLEKACVDPSNFLETLGGSSGAEPRCWMLVFAAGAKVVRQALKGGPRGGTYNATALLLAIKEFELQPPLFNMVIFNHYL